MLNTLRRCPASIRWRLVTTAAKANSHFLLSSPTSLPPSLAKSQSLPFSIRASYHSSQKPHNAAAAVAYETEPEHDTIDKTIAEGPATKFIELAQRGLVDRNIIKTLTKNMGLENMTEVQSLTISEAIKGKDVLAQAKTGTGKTIGFLLPVIQRILQEDPSLSSMSHAVRPARFGERASDIRAIVISPTRELAEQIAEEARKILQNSSMVVQTAVGGTQKGLHLRAMQREGCHILVGTPGRLKDILSDRESGVRAPKLSALVLDEADRLLDQGFMPDIQGIQDLLPTLKDKDRQTLMYSATVSNEVVRLVRSLMKPDLHYVRTVQTDDEPTHERVEQKLVVVPGMENLLPTVLELCQREIDDPSRKRPFKAIVYFNATAETTLASSIFFNIRRAKHTRDPSQGSGGYLSNTRVFEIHSRLTQRQRTTAADLFRQADSAILMSSDVTARGMDFPGVTHVIQVGLPTTRDIYIHRLGRTARAGQEGEGWLLVHDGINQELRARLTKLPLKRDNSLACARVDFETSVAGTEPEGITPTAKQTFDVVSQAIGKVEPAELENTYMALLGTYQWAKDKEWLITMMNRLTKVSWGMERPPAVGRQLASKIGILGVSGLNLSARAVFGDRGGSDRPPSRFGERTDRGERSSPRGGLSDRSDRSDRGGFGDRSDRGDRGSFTPRSDRGGFSSDRGERGGFSPRNDRGGFSDRGDRGSSTPRSGFGGRGDRGDKGGFGGRTDRGGSSTRGGFGGGHENPRGQKWKRN